MIIAATSGEKIIGQTDRQTDRQTDTHTHKDTHRPTTITLRATREGTVKNVLEKQQAGKRKRKAYTTFGDVWEIWMKIWMKSCKSTRVCALRKAGIAVNTAVRNSCYSRRHNDIKRQNSACTKWRGSQLTKSWAAPLILYYIC